MAFTDICQAGVAIGLSDIEFLAGLLEKVTAHTEEETSDNAAVELRVKEDVAVPYGVTLHDRRSMFSFVPTGSEGASSVYENRQPAAYIGVGSDILAVGDKVCIVRISAPVILRDLKTRHIFLEIRTSMATLKPKRLGRKRVTNRCFRTSSWFNITIYTVWAMRPVQRRLVVVIDLNASGCLFDCFGCQLIRLLPSRNF